ncbi:MAG: hypothetical protein DI535_01060 [Citrobacter freundii]|nr:MAG: hypothetical protein DI535_01060 [Citrobacter freundii]
MERNIKIIRRWIVFFMVSLFLSGLTAMPAETELGFLVQSISADHAFGFWLHKVYNALVETNAKAPFLAYGYDWLAFAHFMLAILFIGVYRDPVRNKWIVEFGMIACYMVFPLALIAGHFRQIPLGWRLIDCSFGLLGLVPLMICYRKIEAIEKEHQSQKQLLI